MANLKTLKIRINSVKSTQKITKAMKMVAASKLRRAREAAESARPYAQAMDGMMSRIAGNCGDLSNAPKLMVGTGKDDVQLLVVATADRGLCGAFNSSVVRATRRKVAELKAAGKTPYIYVIGRKGRDLLTADLKSHIIGVQTNIARKTVGYNVAEKIAHKILQEIESRNIDVVQVVYNHFKSAISQVVTFQNLMPLEIPAQEEVSDSLAYDYEPEESVILEDLLPRNLSMQIFKALLESAASEQGARMNAMENATKNAGEMIQKLTLKYNRTRQANITGELIEIISGAEAL